MSNFLSDISTCPQTFVRIFLITESKSLSTEQFYSQPKQTLITDGARLIAPHLKLNVTSPGTAPVTSSNLSITNDVTNHKHNDFMYTLSSACSASEVINLWPLVKVQVVTTSAQIPTKGHNKQSNSTCFKTV